jgi:hypothetical protein
MRLPAIESRIKKGEYDDESFTVTLSRMFIGVRKYGLRRYS